MLYSYFTAQVSQYDLYGLNFCCKYRVAVGETNPSGGSIHQREATLMFMTPACSDLQATSTSKDKLDCSKFSRCLWDLSASWSIMKCAVIWSTVEKTQLKRSHQEKNYVICIVVFCVMIPHTTIWGTIISEERTTLIYRVASKWR